MTTTRYVALLRGINVGGKNQISMPELKALFGRNGFREVSTYINSGNIIFSRDRAGEHGLKEECESLIAGQLGVSIPVVIVPADDLQLALEHAPSWWGREDDSKHIAVFVIPPTSVDEVFAAVGETRPEYERVGVYDRIIFWSAPRETFSRTRWSNVVGSSVYGSITIRNANTVRKLAQLARR
jgi:uncharacterized protein (DUF1697 family)